MIKVDNGNVQLTPAQKRQLATRLKRPEHLGKKLGDFDAVINFNRRGKHIEADAFVHDRVGDFHCHTRQSDLKTAVRELTATLTSRLHDQCVTAQRAV